MPGTDIYGYWQRCSDALALILITYVVIYRPLVMESMSRFLVMAVVAGLCLFVAAHAEEIECALIGFIGCIRSIPQGLLRLSSQKAIALRFIGPPTSEPPALAPDFQRPPPFPTR